LPRVDDGVDLDNEQQLWESILRKLHSRTAGPLRQNILYQGHIAKGGRDITSRR